MGYEYTDEQKGVLNQAQNYGQQTDPYYQKDSRLYNAYQRGDDRKGKLTNFLKPMRVAEGVRREGAVEDYNNSNAPAFNQGGGALTAAADARLREEYDNNEGLAEVGGYVAHGEGLRDRLGQEFENGQNRYLQSLGIASGVANNPHQTTSFWSGLMHDLIAGGSQVAGAYAGK